ncbi:hypothetical protein AK812_SmicGene24964 [Symbiodinium microadriaticum]|uniref:Peptidase M23 domain-containing protein n=1 Tax=Symbiodinium microadriaticum TaxID=2951 RepID=A0A1Q9DD60_SYMMI|nr:hypothetical protein AK812_SmicGene24964 [Symbiodinium microadriaticum]
MLPSPLAASCAAWLRALEARAGGRFILEAGAEFGSLNCWWGKRRPRPAPHEGVDFCDFQDFNSGTKRQIEPGCPVPAVADGQVVAVFEDFMAQTIIMTHQEHLDGRQLATLLAHVVPVPGLAPGQRCSPDVEVAAVAASRTTAPAHVHLSVLAAAPGFAWASLQGWPDLLQLHEQKELHFLEPPVPVEPWRAHLDLGGEQQ